MKTWDAVYQEWQTDDGQIHAMRMGLLIRCKDCKHYVHEQPGMVYCPIIVGGWVEEDGYCYMAERKEDGTI